MSVTGVGVPAAEQLWCHVRDGPRQCLGLLGTSARQGVEPGPIEATRDPEVHDRDVVARDDDVCGLEVAVKHAAFVRMREGGSDLGTEPAGLCCRQRRFGEHVGKRPPLHEFHHEVGLATLLSHLVNGADVRVRQASGGLSLLAEPRGCAERIAVGPENLQRDVALEHLVPRAVHVAHAARAKKFDHSVVTDAIETGFARVIVEPRSRRLKRRRLQEPVIQRVGVEKRLHVGGQAHVATCFRCNERGACRRLALERAMVDVFDPPPVSVRLHGAILGGARPWRSSNPASR